MLRPLSHFAVLVGVVGVAALSACPGEPLAPDEGAVDGGTSGEGEGEGDVGEGEGEGEGDGEGEGEGEGEGDAGEGEGDGGEGEGEGDDEPHTVASCFEGIASATGVTPNYDQFGPVVGSH